jgi:uncharacterized protein (TIGR02145 family)
MDSTVLKEIERLKHDFNDLKSEISELNKAINKSQISNSRKRGVYTSAGATCEAILKFIYQKECLQGKPVNKLMLDELLIKVGDFIPPQVLINFRTIQAWRNLGTHDKDDMRTIDSNSLLMVDMALSHIVNWFFSSYLKIEYSNQNIDLVVNNELQNAIEKREKDSLSKHTEIIEHNAKAKNVNKKTYIDDLLVNPLDSLNKMNIPITKQSQTNKESFNVEYEELIIGNQIWMCDNLSAVEFRNGDFIRQAKTKDEWLEAGENCEPVWCFYRSDAKGDKTPGLLYNWYAANDPRCLAPKGWRIPNSDDFKELIRFCGGENYVQKRFDELKGFKGIFRRKHTGTYTNGSNFAWWTISSGRTNGYCFEFVGLRFCESGFPKATGFPLVCIKETAL